MENSMGQIEDSISEFNAIEEKSHQPLSEKSAAQIYMGEAGMNNPKLTAHFEVVRHDTPKSEENKPTIKNKPNPVE